MKRKLDEMAGKELASLDEQLRETNDYSFLKGHEETGTNLLKASEDGDEETIKALIDPSKEHVYHDHVLFNACEIAADHGHLSVLRVLLDYYNLTYTQSDKGYKLLISAIKRSKSLAVETLFQAGISKDYKLDDGTALGLALH
tara:strand:- start:30 stop:458 length:429 start_codon:yes stop_codon:yes gene_type:complete